jgi:chlorite dismutase
MQSRSEEPADSDSGREAPSATRYVQYLFFGSDPAWRRLPEDQRAQGRREFVSAVRQAEDVTTYAYSTLGLKAGVDLMLWRSSDSLDALQDALGRLLATGLGRYLKVTHSLFGMTRASVYTKRRTTQEQAIGEEERLRYFTVYPFSKTAEWYLMSKEARQGMMNEHMRVGHEFPAVRQVLLYSTGLDDHEFVVAYETDDLPAYQSLVIALRSTEARRYTLKDTPVFTAIHRPLDEALELLG